MLALALWDRRSRFARPIRHIPSLLSTPPPVREWGFGDPSQGYLAANAASHSPQLFAPPSHGYSGQPLYHAHLPQDPVGAPPAVATAAAAGEGGVVRRDSEHLEDVRGRGREIEQEEERRRSWSPGQDKENRDGNAIPYDPRRESPEKRERRTSKSKEKRRSVDHQDGEERRGSSEGIKSRRGSKSEQKGSEGRRSSSSKRRGSERRGSQKEARGPQSRDRSPQSSNKRLSRLKVPEPRRASEQRGGAGNSNENSLTQPSEGEEADNVGELRGTTGQSLGTLELSDRLTWEMEEMDRQRQEQRLRQREFERERQSSKKVEQRKRLSKNSPLAEKARQARTNIVISSSSEDETSDPSVSQTMQTGGSLEASRRESLEANRRSSLDMGAGGVLGGKKKKAISASPRFSNELHTAFFFLSFSSLFSPTPIIIIIISIL